MILDIVIDALIVVVVLVGIFLGIKLGFVKIIAKPIKFCLSVAISAWLCNPIAKNVLVPLIGAPVSNQIKSYLIQNYPNLTPETALEEIPTILKFAATLLDIDASALSPESIIESLVDTLALPLIYILSLIVTFVVLYFLSKLLLSVLFSLLNSVFDDGFLSLPNKILGCVFNTFAALALIWIFTVAFEFVIHLPLFESYAWVQEFNGGFIYSFFKSLNPVDLLLSF
ncbi:MAG: hypothetical protein J6Q68_02110 [Clostridia bacterium]|nr:hypothetical protein [Clostridia bacterium]